MPREGGWGTLSLTGTVHPTTCTGFRVYQNCENRILGLLKRNIQMASLCLDEWEKPTNSEKSKWSMTVYENIPWWGGGDTCIYRVFQSSNTFLCPSCPHKPTQEEGLLGIEPGNFSYVMCNNNNNNNNNNYRKNNKK